MRGHSRMAQSSSSSVTGSAMSATSRTHRRRIGAASAASNIWIGAAPSLRAVAERVPISRTSSTRSRLAPKISCDTLKPVETSRHDGAGLLHRCNRSREGQTCSESDEAHDEAGSTMRAFSTRIDSILGVGRFLESQGVRNWALTRSEALVALAELDAEHIAVSGGAVFAEVGGRMRSTRDAWYCDQNAGETSEAFLRRSIAEARGFITRYPEDGETPIFFAIDPHPLIVPR